MDLCVLPQTGAAEQWLVLVAVAVVVIGAGIALAVSGKARRRVATGLGALAIVGALAIGGVHAAPAAQADAGSSCVTAPAGAPAPAADVVVTPGIPALAQQCNVESTVVTPTTAGITYTPTRAGQIVTVTATANPGYRITTGATTSWQYDVTAAVPAPSPIAIPAGVRADFAGTVPTENGTLDSFSAPESTFAADAIFATNGGQLAHAFNAAAAAITVDITVADAEGVQTTYTAVAPVSGAAFAYDAALALYTFGVPADQLPAVEQSIEDQVNAFPIDLETDTLVAGRQYVAGLQVDLEWDGGPVCGVQTASVPIDAVYDELVIEAPVPVAAADVPSGIIDLAPLLAPSTTDAAPVVDAADEAEVVEAPATEAPAEVVESPEPEVATPVEG